VNAQDGIHNALRALNLGALAGGGSFAGVDQGIDITGGPFAVKALADGVITRLTPSGSGWPGQGALLVYRLTSGPYAGRFVYIAEDFNPDPSLRVGSPVKQGQQLGIATGSGEAPGIEAGFADPQGHAFGSPHGGPQPLGQAFLNYVENVSAGTAGAAAEFGTGSASLGLLPSLGPFPTSVHQAAQELTGAGRVVSGAGSAAVGGSKTGGAPSNYFEEAALFFPCLLELTGGRLPLIGGLIKKSEVTSDCEQLASDFLFRTLEIVGGFLLLLVGLILLGRQFGLRPPTAAPLYGTALKAEDASSEAFQLEPGEAAHYERQRTSRPGIPRGRRRRVSLPADRPPPRRTPRSTPSEEVPF